MNTKKREYKNSIKIKNLLESDELEELRDFINKKTEYLQEIIRNTTISIKLNKQREIFSDIDSNLSITILTDLYLNCVEIAIHSLKSSKKELDGCINSLQNVIDKLSMIISGFGTSKIEDLIYIVFGVDNKFNRFYNNVIQKKCDLINKYVQPIGYKIINWKQGVVRKTNIDEIVSNKMSEGIIEIENQNTYECFNSDKITKSLYQKINGINIVIQNEKLKKTLLIYGIVEDIPLECFSNEYITQRIKEINEMSKDYQQTERDIIKGIIESMNLKDLLIYGKNDIYKKMMGLLIEINTIKQEGLEITIKKYLELEAISKRNMLINMLIYNKDDSVRYICYLLHDLINANNENSKELYIYESLPWKLKKQFNNMVKYTIAKNDEMTQKSDMNKINLEQQIYMMKATDYVKEKAFVKLKEIKGKPDEISAKSKQYLEGLIKIPFGIYKEEKILKKSKENNSWLIRLLDMAMYFFPELGLLKKDKYTNLEMSRIIKKVIDYVNENVLNIIKKKCEDVSAKQVAIIVQSINTIIKQKKEKKIQLANQTKRQHIENIINYLELNQKDIFLLLTIYDKIFQENNLSLHRTINDINILKTDICVVEKYIKSVNETLDESIYSHDHAKNQILKIIAQWMNGEQTGYCFGFEGSPGIGKTSLAKNGLSKCLIDENGNSRPFHFIALGGSTCGSNIEGHGYTYANSTWGKIVDILIESKCMNPIIYIDELDKVSKTENGRDIINIFIHLIDSTQNNAYQDKYFTGIDLDLSKALFIFSYNDPSEIDRILLDRIHRVKFDNLTTKDKIIIVNKYIIPEINKRMGFENVVEMDDEIIKYIIDSYTAESGVRKLKELLFDLYGEINLKALNGTNDQEMKMPIKITKDLLETKYLVKYKKINEKKIHSVPEIGIINGLWANSLGNGGIIPIQTLFFPSPTFLELKLTGLQGDVMKESMNVAKTLAWNLTEDSIKIKWIKTFEETKCQGLHIHCPEGAVSKDGPSAGAAITTAIYSLLNNKLIKNDIAITGEISLNGEITEIGGLEVKISGGIRAGAKTILYPKANANDFIEWKKNNIEIYNATCIKFIEINTIKDIFNVMFM